MCAANYQSKAFFKLIFNHLAPRGAQIISLQKEKPDSFLFFPFYNIFSTVAAQVTLSL